MEELFRQITDAALLVGIREECVAETAYLGESDRWLNITSRAEPTFFADDTAMADEYTYDLDMYIPVEENYRVLERKFRRELEKRGFDNVILEDQLYDDESEKRHLVFNASITVMREGE